MEHARKLVLLPRESLGNLQSAPSETVQTPGTVLSRLDQQMSDVLNSVKKDEYEKWKLYNQILQRYLHFKEAACHKLNADVSNIIDSAVSDNIDIDDQIVSSVPKSFRDKAKKLLLCLRKAGNVSWDSKNSLTIDGARVRGNIVDLVNYAMRSRKTAPPCGSDQFAIALRQAAIPIEFVGNERVRDIIRKTPSISSDERDSQTAGESSPSITSTPNNNKKKKRKSDSDDATTLASSWKRLNLFK